MLNSFKVTRLKKKFNSFPLSINYCIFFRYSRFFKAYSSSNLIISKNSYNFLMHNFLKKKCIFELHHDISTESRLINIIF